jgi:hypothetical protein
MLNKQKSQLKSVNHHHASRVRSGALEAETLDWFFRFGFASVFLINSIIALIEPAGFIKLMQGSVLGQVIHNFTPFVWLIAANDALIAGLIVWGRWRALILAWSGLWLLIVTLIKFSDLVH